MHVMPHAVKSFVFWSQIMLKDLCQLPFGCISEVVQRQRLFLPGLRVICTHHVAPETPVLWFGASEREWEWGWKLILPFCWACATRGMPCTPVILFLLAFQSRPGPQCSEISLQWRWRMRPSCRLERFPRWQAVVCSLQGWDSFMIRMLCM